MPPWKTLVHSLALGGPTALNGVQSEKTREMHAQRKDGKRDSDLLDSRIE